ncbi:MAG: hypothetical protein ABSB23_00240 [Bryobacteraceae bacterium]|jgi:hypothetical protein
MPLFKITGQGLSAIAVSVALLWGCLLGAGAQERRAMAARGQVMRQLRLLQERNRRRPLSVPFPHHHRQPQPIAA